MIRTHRVAPIVVALLIALALPAAAQEYPPAGDTISIGSTTLSPGASTTLSGSGADAGAVITATFLSQPVGLGSTDADASGAWSMVVTIPSDATPGIHAISASGAGYSASVTVTIVGGAPAPARGRPVAGQIAFTGSDGLLLAGIGAGLLTVGAAFVLAGRRRTRGRLTG